MKVIHLDEREAMKLLEGCEAAKGLLDAAVELVGKPGPFVEAGYNLERAISLLRTELGLGKKLTGSFDEQAEIRRSTVS